MHSSAWRWQGGDYFALTNMQRYRTKLAQRTLEDIIEVPPEIGVPIIETLTHIQDCVISEMFVELLALASEREALGGAHPAFVSIINNLAPDEALLLKAMDGWGHKYYGNCGFVVKPEQVGPILEPTYFLLDPMYVDRSGLSSPEFIGAYIGNLARLGLVTTASQVPPKEVLRMECVEPQHELGNPITRIKERYTAEKEKSSVFAPQNMQVHWWFGRVDYTEFGHLFRHACIERVPRRENTEPEE